jgi:hypothetical protein
MTVPAGATRPVAAGARRDGETRRVMATEWAVLQSQQTEFGLVELRYAVFGKGRARVRSWKIFCEGFQVNYGAIESDAWVNYERAIKGDFRDRPECPAGDACTGAPFPGHPGHP